MATLEQLAKHVGAVLSDPSKSGCNIEQVSTLDGARKGQIAFLFDRKYRKFLKITRASAVILREQDAEGCSVPALITKDPYLAYAKIANLLNTPKTASGSVHPSAVVHGNAKIDSSVDIAANSVIESNVVVGANVLIGPGCVIGEGAMIGDYTRLIANVTVCHHVSIGKRALIHPGAVLGSDGFGLARDGVAWVKIPHIGSVCVGDDVEIGANTTIDRGAIKDTVIENGVKLDNQVQVAHNVHIGEHSALAGCVGIAGSATIGKHCMLGGGVGIAGHLEIADDVTITGMSMVTKSIKKAGTYSSGWSVKEAKQWRRTVARVHQLDFIKKNKETQ